MGKAIDGKAIASRINRQCARFARDHAVDGRMCAILVGNDPASAIYVRNKRKRFFDLGIDFSLYHFPKGATEAELVKLVMRLNADPKVTGILIQQPMPESLDARRLTSMVHPLKDVDGLGLISMGRLMQDRAYMTPCTPAGVVVMLKKTMRKMEGKRAVIVGRSLLVGRPLIDLLLKENCTVTSCHTRTKNLKKVTSEADILIAATGRARLITPSHVKNGAVVIDVGITRGNDGKLAGDVDFARVVKKAAAVSPVPGGVGPMTMAMIVYNFLKAWCLQRGLDYHKIAQF